jgi:hypothetical protein
MPIKVKQKAIAITPKNWRLAERAAKSHKPPITRPVFVNVAIEEKAERQGVK